MSLAERSIICLRCPRGCEIQTSLDGYGSIVEFHGNLCAMGKEYAEAEVSNPRRTLTTTVRVRHGETPLVPVWTPKPIPKHLVRELAAELRSIELEAPVEPDTTVVTDWKGLGIEVVTSGAVRRKA